MDNKSWKINPDERKENSPWWKFESASSMALAFGAILCIIGGAWYHIKNNQDETPKELPIIKAEDGPSKIRPESAEKTIIEHEDKLVYNKISSDNNIEQLEEKVLPGPEEPLSVEDYVSEKKDNNDLNNTENLLSDNDLLEEVASDDEMILEDNLDNSSNEKMIDLSEIKIEEKEDKDIFKEIISKPTIVPKQKIKVDIKNSKNMTSAVNKINLSKNISKSDDSLSSGYSVQLASVKTTEQAQSVWDGVKHIYLIKDHNVNFRKVDLGKKKGIYYRVQIGKFSNYSDASKLCDGIKSLGKDCLVAKF